jgi:polyisoprenoid-binding protein YceI
VTRYSIDPTRSKVWIDAKSSLHPIHTSTDGLEGFIEIATDGDGKVDLSAPPAGRLSLPVSKLQSGNRLEDRELQKRIDSRRYPTIDGVLKAMAADGADGRYRVTGTLTFHGVPRECADVMTVRVVDDSTVHLEGESTFDIRDFGMEPPRILMLKVAPDVKVRVDIPAVKGS